MLGASTAVGLAGCAPSEASEKEAAPSSVLDAESYANAQWDFMVPPEPVADSDITEERTCDILIVGAGVAGLCLACRAAELSQGKDEIVVVAASSKHVERGGSFHGIGTKVQEEYGIEYDLGNLGAKVKTECIAGGYQFDMRKWARWFQNSKESMDWLIDKMRSYEGVRISLEMPFKDAEGILDLPAGAHNFLMDDEKQTKENGGIFSITTMKGAMDGVVLVNDVYEHEFVNIHGGRIDYSTKAEYLLRGDDNTGRVSGLIASDPDGRFVKYSASKAVVLATGDFSADESMMRKYCARMVDAQMLTFQNVNYDNCSVMGGLMPGDGQKMGLWIGAAWQKNEQCAPNVCALGNGPQSRGNGSPSTIILNKDGNRFMNEDTTFSYYTYGVMNQKDQTAFEIWDAAYANHYDVWNGYGVSLPLPDGGYSMEFLHKTPQEALASWDEGAENGSYLKADTLEDLLSQLEKEGLDSTQASKTIAAYNGYCEAGFDSEYLKDPSELATVKDGPFYAYKLTVGPACFLTVHGGLRTDEHMRVCEADDSPIEGLYNIGVMTGDMFSNIYTFSVAGQSLGATCTTFPYLLANELVNGADA